MHFWLVELGGGLEQPWHRSLPAPVVLCTVDNSHQPFFLVKGPNLLCPALTLDMTGTLSIANILETNCCSTQLTEQAPQNQQRGKLEQEPGLESGRNAEFPRSQNTFTSVHAGDDSRQLIVSTTGVVIHAEDVSTGSRTSHGMGQMSDESIQELLQHISQPTIGQGPRITQQDNGSWQEQYGKGHNFTQQ